jgi:hypothetical protein
MPKKGARTAKRAAPRRGLNPNEDTVIGRIDTMLQRRGHTNRSELQRAIGVSPGLLAMKARLGVGSVTTTRPRPRSTLAAPSSG